jgi:tetratricopeptide (TPR) repeat protein
MEATRAASGTMVRAGSLVGRTQELADLHEVLDRSIQYETPQSVLLVGNQGVGKSRLLDAWTEQAQDRHPELRILRCQALPAGAGYGLFSSLLEARFGLKGATDPQEHFRAQVEEVLLDRRLTEVLHFLGVFLGVSVRENPFLKALEDAPAQHDQIARTVLRRFLEMDAGRTPLLLILEDLQRADEASLSLFQELAWALAGAPLTLVGSCRPELFVGHPKMGRLEGDHTRIDLAPLSREESEAMLRQLLVRAQDLPSALIETAVDMAGGNPFFLEELVRLLIDNGSIKVEGDRWTVDAERVEEVELPMTVEETVHARIAALTPAERDVLEKASVLGGVFWLESLVCFTRLEQEVAEKSNLWMADVLQQTITEILEGLIERDYLMHLPDSSIPEGTEYAFKHNLERELIGKMLDPARKKQYHRFAAQWLETKIPDRSEAQLEYLGQHYEAGGNTRRAAFCFVHAGDRARARYANDRAASFYKHGVGLLDLDDAISKIEALHNLGDVCFILGRTGEALEHFAEMLHYAWLLDHKGKGGAAHRRIGRVYTTLGEYERSLEHLNIALRLFERGNDARGRAAALADVGLVSMLKGDYEQALSYHRQALAIKREIGDPRSIAVSLNNIGTVHQSSGQFKAALDCFVEALEIRKQVQDRLGIVDSLVNLGGAYRAQADYAKAFQLWTEALKLAREIGDRLHEGYLHISLGEAQLQLGKVKESEQHLNDAAVIAQDLGDRRLRADCSRAMCEVKLALGDRDGAEEQAQQAYEIAEHLGLKPEMAAALRALGEVVAARTTDEQTKAKANKLFSKAVELFAELGNDLELARTFAVFADYHDRCGSWQEADHFRQRADEIFNRLKRVRPATPAAGPRS